MPAPPPAYGTIVDGRVRLISRRRSAANASLPLRWASQAAAPSISARWVSSHPMAVPKMPVVFGVAVAVPPKICSVVPRAHAFPGAVCAEAVAVTVTNARNTIHLMTASQSFWACAHASLLQVAGLASSP